MAVIELRILSGLRNTVAILSERVAWYRIRLPNSVLDQFAGEVRADRSNMNTSIKRQTDERPGSQYSGDVLLVKDTISGAWARPLLTVREPFVALYPVMQDMTGTLDKSVSD